jgi:hypothetical protein
LSAWAYQELVSASHTEPGAKPQAQLSDAAASWASTLPLIARQPRSATNAAAAAASAQ